MFGFCHINFSFSWMIVSMKNDFDIFSFVVFLFFSTLKLLILIR